MKEGYPNHVWASTTVPYNVGEKMETDDDGYVRVGLYKLKDAIYFLEDHLKFWPENIGKMALYRVKSRKDFTVIFKTIDLIDIERINKLLEL